MNAMIEAFVRHINHYYASLPYNLNWGVKTRLLRGFLSEHPLSIIDIGARGGGAGELAGLTEFIRYVGFDADEEECRRLTDAHPGKYADYRVYPYFIGGGGTVEFHLYSERGWSSTYEIDGEFQPRLPGAFSASGANGDTGSRATG